MAPLFRRRRISLLIALAFLAVALTLSDVIANASDSRFATVGGQVLSCRCRSRVSDLELVSTLEARNTER